MSRHLPIAPSSAKPGSSTVGAGAPALRVGELAKRTGKSVRALHLYEERGLLAPSERSKGGYRLYQADSVTRVHWINHLQGIGFSLPKIRNLLEMWELSESAPEAVRKVEQLYRDKLSETREQIAHLKMLEGELEASLRYLEDCESVCNPQELIAACGCCERHNCEDRAPVLVAGFSAH